MGEQLTRLLEEARQTRMSVTAENEQRISFAFGNTNFENPDITREMVASEAEKLRNGAQD